MKPIHFKVKEYPEIIVEETHFKIKAIDYWEFRSFNFDEVVSVELINPQKRWYYQLYFIFSLMARIFANEEPLLLRITKKMVAFGIINTKMNIMPILEQL